MTVALLCSAAFCHHWQTGIVSSFLTNPVVKLHRSAALWSNLQRSGLSSRGRRSSFDVPHLARKVRVVSLLQKTAVAFFVQTGMNRESPFWERRCEPNYELGPITDNAKVHPSFPSMPSPTARVGVCGLKRGHDAGWDQYETNGTHWHPSRRQRIGLHCACDMSVSTSSYQEMVFLFSNDGDWGY